MGLLFDLLTEVVEVTQDAQRLRKQADEYEHGCDPRPFELLDEKADDKEREAEQLFREAVREALR